MKVQILNKSIEKEICENFILDDYRLFLKVQGLSHESIMYYINYIYLFIKYSKLNNIDCFNNYLKIKVSYNKLFDKGFKESTIIKYRKTIIKFYTFLLENDLAEKNYGKNLTQIKQEKSLPKALEEQYIPIITNHILKSYKIDFYRYRTLLIFNTFLNTGVRRSEIVNIKKNNITSQYIKIEKGKGNKDRIIYISKTFAKTLKDYMEIQDKNNEYIFCESNGKQMTRDGINQIFKKLQKETGIKVYPHLLRHTYASLCVKRGINLYTLQQQMGHTDLKTTSIYLYMNSRENWEEIQKLNI